MDARTALLAGLLVLCTYNAWQRWEGRPVHPRDGALAPDEPVQTDVERAAPVRHGRWLLTARASYDITARILSREDYRFDRIADLVPEDLALGWGPMSDNHVLAAFDVSQGARFYTWRPRGPLPIAREDVIVHRKTPTSSRLTRAYAPNSRVCASARWYISQERWSMRSATMA